MKSCFPKQTEVKKVFKMAFIPLLSTKKIRTNVFHVQKLKSPLPFFTGNAFVT